MQLREVLHGPSFVVAVLGLPRTVTPGDRGPVVHAEIRGTV